MNTSAFSSPEGAVLSRQTEDDENENLDWLQVWNEAHKNMCIEWIQQGGYKKVCLQFPDKYLVFSVTISDSLKEVLDQDVKVFILADTSYGSCCVDEIAAAHVEADSLIHFGTACRSKAARLPVLYVYPQLCFSPNDFIKKLDVLSGICNGKQIYVYLDIGYHHVLDKSLEGGDPCLNVQLGEKLPTSEIHLEAYPCAEETKPIHEPAQDRVCIFVGKNNIRFANLSLTSKAAYWFIYDPVTDTLTEQNPLTANFIRRRYFYIEKCKDARTLGLIVATLTSTGYLEVVARIQEMAKKRGIKTQIISVGRINPAKLANFLEIDCFVLIGCAFNNMFNSKDYYKPIVSVFEAEMALNPAWYMKYPEVYVTDFRDLLPEGKQFMEFRAADIREQDISLVSGHIRHATINNGTDDSQNDPQLALERRGKMELMTSQTNLSFEDRTWKGLDVALGCTEPAKLQKGLSGIPISYNHD